MIGTNLDAINDPDDVVRRLDKTAEICSLLADYALAKADAVTFRQTGFISAALLKEKECERIYQKLPKEVQW